MDRPIVLASRLWLVSTVAGIVAGRQVVRLVAGSVVRLPGSCLSIVAGIVAFSCAIGCWFQLCD